MSGVRAALLLVAATIAMAVLARPPAPYGSTHRTEFPPIDGDVSGSLDIARLPVTLVDLTGQVTAIEPNDWAIGVDDPDTEILRLEGEPTVLRVAWTGGACAAEAKIGLALDGRGGAVVTVHEETSLGGRLGCAGLGVPRRLTIRFDHPVDTLPFRVVNRPS